MPDSGTIIACRGRLDFYEWKGIPVVRSWPRKSIQPRQPGEIASSTAFTAAAVLTGAIDPNLMQAWRDFIAGHGVGVTWIDMFRAQVRGRGWIG